MSVSIKLVMGPMFSGKTVHLMRLIERVAFLGNSYMYYINSSCDIREDSEVSSHSKLLKKHGLDSIDNLTMLKIDNLDAFISILRNKLSVDPSHGYHVFIDEAQFFDDLLQFVACILKNFNNHGTQISITIAGLISDSNNKKFGQVWDILPFCRSVKKLNSLCSECAKNGTIEPALHSLRIRDKDTSQVHIGDHHQYKPVCTLCYYKYIDNDS